MFQLKDGLARYLIISERGTGLIPFGRFRSASPTLAILAQVDVERYGAGPATRAVEESQPCHVLRREWAISAMSLSGENGPMRPDKIGQRP